MLTNTCYTDCGKWEFEAYTDKDAFRLALYYCWRDDEEFIKVEGRKALSVIPLTSVKSITIKTTPSLTFRCKKQ